MYDCVEEMLKVTHKNDVKFEYTAIPTYREQVTEW